MIRLRDYQELGKSLLYQAFNDGHKKVVFWGATGSGKTTSFCDLVSDCYKLNMPCVIIMRRRELIFQTSARLDEFNIPHGVYMAGHHKFKPKRLVQVCSIDTLEARKAYPHVDLQNKVVIIDESHDCTPKAKKYAKLFKEYCNDYIVGFTATPYTDNSLFEKIICPIEAHELRDRGYLVPARVFVPSLVDASKVKIGRDGEFDEKELFELVARKEIIGDCVRDWKRYGQNRPTLIFAVNVAHSKMICEEYNAAGIKTIHLDAKSSSDERKRAFKKLKRGEINAISNVDICSTGVDIPVVSCVQILRPSQSIVWHIQAIGRGLRTSPETGKKDCMIIDNVGNIYRHGDPYTPREATIDKPKKGKSDDEPDINIRTCKKCFFIFKASIRICPSCGFMNPVIEREIKTSEGELEEYKLSPEEIALIEKRNFVNDFHKLSHVERIRGFKKDWKFHQLKKKHGLTVCQQYGKMFNMPEYILE